MATVYPSYSDAARDIIARTLRLSPITISGWLRCEGSGPGKNNGLNARGPVMPHAIGFTPAPGDFAIFASLQDAADDYLYRLRNVHGVGYEDILALAGTDKPYEQARAIEQSSWAGGHYGGLTSDGCIARYVLANSVSEDTMPMIAEGGLTVHSTYVVDVPAGTPYYDGTTQRGTFGNAATVDYLGIPIGTATFAVRIRTAGPYADGKERDTIVYIKRGTLVPRKRTAEEDAAAAQAFNAPDCAEQVSAVVARYEAWLATAPK